MTNNSNEMVEKNVDHDIRKVGEIKVLKDGVWSDELFELVQEFGYSVTSSTPETLELLGMNPRESLRRALEEVLKSRQLFREVEEALSAFKLQTETHGGDYLPGHAIALYVSLSKVRALLGSGKKRKGCNSDHRRARGRLQKDFGSGQ